MTKKEASKLADTISNERLKEMFQSAKEQIKNWNATSVLNVAMSKGMAWNILTKAFGENKPLSHLVKRNMLREFGDYLPGWKPQSQPKRKYQPPHHQPPDFTGWD